MKIRIRTEKDWQNALNEFHRRLKNMELEDLRKIFRDEHDLIYVKKHTVGPYLRVRNRRPKVVHKRGSHLKLIRGGKA